MSKRLFCDGDLAAVLDNQIKKAREEIDSCEEDYLLNVSENDFVEHLVSKFTVNCPQLGEPFMLEPREVDVDVGRDPMRGGWPPRPVRGSRVEIHVPFAGDADLFRFRPSTFTTSAPLASIGQDHIAFVYSSPGPLDPQRVRRYYEQEL